MSEPQSEPPPRKHGVVAVLQDERGRYLVIRRGLTLKRAPGWWCFPGGEVEPGESLPDAIRRELLEELGLPIEPLAEIHQSVSPNNEYLLHWFSARPIEPNTPVVPHPVEVAEVCWLAASEILALPQVLPGLVAWLQAPPTQ